MTNEKRNEIIDSLVQSARLNLFHQGYDQCQIEEHLMVYREQLEDKSDIVLTNLLMINC